MNYFYRLFTSSFTSLEKISLGQGDPVIRIKGLQRQNNQNEISLESSFYSHSNEETHIQLSQLPSQLVIRGCQSVTIGGMYKRLLKRCLNSIIASLKSLYKTSTYNSSMISSLTTIKQDEIICSIGCGISELIWSIFMEEIANHLQNSSSSTIIDIQKLSKPFEKLIFTYLESITKLLPKNNSPDIQASNLLSLIQCCRYISNSYLQIPLLTLQNSSQATIHYGRNLSPQRALLIWKDNLKQVLYQERNEISDNQLQLLLIPFLVEDLHPSRDIREVYYLADCFFNCNILLTLSFYVILLLIIIHLFIC